MKLTDIKKLKVAELRSKLQELGLDNKGLKAELVGRLWSACEARQTGEDGVEEIKIQHVPSPTPSEPTETVDVRAPSSSPPTEAGVTARCKVDCPSREFTDSATQTETDTGLTPPQPGSEFTSGCVSVYQEEEEEEEEEEVEEVEMQQGDAEDPGEDRRAELGRGRAFYEFKEEIRYKRAKSPQPPADREETGEEDEDGVRLNPHDSHLHFEVGPDGARGQPRFWARFPLLWSGCRLTYGAFQGRVGFEVRLERTLSNTQGEMDPHGLRAGWSMTNTSLLLGEDELSFAYDGRGKKVSGGTEEEFGEPFSVGDIIGCYAMLLIVGLPGSGKSHWARTHMKQHPEKQYRLLGTEELLTCMMSGGQRDSRLQQACQCLTDLIKMAAQTPGNYILDQCNILFSARRHKLQLFTGFRRRAVVVFPSADEWRRRLSQHQTSDGDQIPETALLKLQVSCCLPEQQCDLLEELQYVELPQEKAQTLLQEYKDEARRLLPPVPKQEKKKPRLYRKRPHPHSVLPSYRTQWTGPHGWSNMQSWRQQPRYWNPADQDQACYYYRDSSYEGYW
ncbi:heterogeneous nuclear ribonucleoprotein U-like protein 2 isoform X2 [Sparus aurata]|uniref:heterogeneous nuclear ribonucleoprotein U-like protein 2 isoform X2 n=1 Tax=Sparus aurata TaxID=8175 RepID=UPI0011C11ECC|nr:heterogeneous nuclear ribonucleoprotein U-like protein 2 isoform X2 [Sparus aurata]